jgi:ATP-dependent RNA helicase RhlE
MSKQTFAELGVSNAVVTCLGEGGINEPFQIQREVIGDVLAGRDVLARSPTGSGKTLAFGIPIVDRIAAEARRPAALILAPTRELATQIVDEIRPIAHARALRIAAVYGGVGLIKQGQNAARSHIIVATPGRLEDQLSRRAFNLNHVEILVLDEADRMLDMGFKPAVDRIVNLCSRKRQTLFFSATLDGEAGRVARSYTQNPVSHEYGPTERRANSDVEHRFVEVTHDTRMDALVEQLQGDRELALVFVRTKHGADKLVKKLSTQGVAAVAMHGNKTQAQRERALAQFESWKVDTLVATDVAARGIDVNGISHVINFDPPHDSETYVHRIGRTARAGATGIGITLVAPDQRREVGKMAGELGIAHGLDAGTHHGARPPHGRGHTPQRGQREQRPGHSGGQREQRPRHGGGQREQRPRPNGGRRTRSTDRG